MAVLNYFLKNPFMRHSHQDLIENAWPDDAYKEGVTPDAIYQTIRGIRTRIEPNPSQPFYLITWRGGGYQFFPEGRPQHGSE